MKCSSAWTTKSFAYSIVSSCLITEQKVPRAYEEVRKFEDDLKNDLEEDTRERLKSVLGLCSVFISGNDLLFPIFQERFVFGGELT